MAPIGFECARMDGSISHIISKRLEEGSMNAKGEGGWEGCKWEKELNHSKSNQN